MDRRLSSVLNIFFDTLRKFYNYSVMHKSCITELGYTNVNNVRYSHTFFLTLSSMTSHIDGTGPMCERCVRNCTYNNILYGYCDTCALQYSSDNRRYGVTGIDESGNIKFTSEYYIFKLLEFLIEMDIELDIPDYLVCHYLRNDISYENIIKFILECFEYKIFSYQAFKTRPNHVLRKNPSRNNILSINVQQ